MSKASYQKQASSDYPDQLSELPRYCYSDKIFFNQFFSLFRDMTGNYSCLPRLPSRGKCRKVSFPRIQQNDAIGFESNLVYRIRHHHGALPT